MISEMTGDQSRTLKVGERVCWKTSATDLGTIVGTAWNGVSIEWDDGQSTSIQHHDMGRQLSIESILRDIRRHRSDE